MVSIDDEKGFAAALQARFEKKRIQSEMESLAFWKEEVDRILALKPDGVASLQVRVKKLSEMMANRISMLKRGIT